MLLSACHRIAEIDSFTKERTVWIYENAQSQPGTSFLINFLLRSQLAPQTPMEMDPAAAPTLTSNYQTQPTV